MPGVPADYTNPSPLQENALGEFGFLKSVLGSECWACGEVSYKRKPRPNSWIWRCDCGTEWATPVG